MRRRKIFPTKPVAIRRLASVLACLLLIFTPARERAITQSLPQGALTDAQLADAARAEAQRRFGDSASDWPAGRQPDGGVSVRSPDGNQAVIARRGEGGAVDLEIRSRRDRFVDVRRKEKGVWLELSITGVAGPVVPIGDPIGPENLPAAPTPTPAAPPAPPDPPTPAPPEIRLVPVGGPPDSVVLGQRFRVEVIVPTGQAQSKTFDVTLATADGVDDTEVTVNVDDAAPGMVTYRSEPVSIGGVHGDWRVSILPFGFGNVSLGGLKTPGTIMGLDLGNGDSITATVALPNGTAGASIQVFDTPTDQALKRCYEAMFAWQETLRLDIQIQTLAQSSPLFTPDEQQVIKGQLANNLILRTWLNETNQAVAGELRPYAQLAILSSTLRRVTAIYEGGFAATATGDADEEKRDLNAAIARDIERWKNGVAESFLQGTALAFYNGVTAIPFTNAGYTLTTSLYTSFEKGTFNTGQTVWGTEATKGQWVWAWVEIAGQASMMRMYSNPSLGLNPFRDPRATVQPLIGPNLTLLHPVERAIFNQAARLAEKVAGPGADAATLLAAHQRMYAQLGPLASRVGLPHAARALDAINDAWMKNPGKRLPDLADVLDATRAPRLLPPVMVPPAVAKAPPAAPVAPIAPAASSVPPVGWPAVPAVATPPVGPVIPGGVIFVDPLLLAMNKIAHKQGLAGVPQHLLAGTPAQQALMRQAVLNPSRVRVSAYNVNVGPDIFSKSGELISRGGVLPRKLTKEEWAFLCSGGSGAARTGPGATQAGSLPFFGAMGNCLQQRFQSGDASATPAGATSAPNTIITPGTTIAPEAATTPISVDWDAIADSIDWMGCPYDVRSPTSRRVKYCTNWFIETAAKNREQWWTAFGVNPAVNTIFLGERPPLGPNPFRPLRDFELDKFKADRFDFDAFLNALESPVISNAADDDPSQYKAARWRVRRLFSLSDGRLLPSDKPLPKQPPFTLAANVPRPPTLRPGLSAFLHAVPFRTRLAQREETVRVIETGREPELWLPAASQERIASASRGVAPDLKLFFVSLGRSSGEATRMTIVNTGNLPMRIRGHALALRPLAKVTQSDVERELKRLAAFPQLTVTIDSYCQNFDKLPPREGMVFGLADAQAQLAMAPTHGIFDVVDRLEAANALQPDSDAEEYKHALIQWSIWTLEQRFDERSYTRAFVGHARKNVEAGGRRWTSEIEKAVTALAPGRWRAIEQVLREAGALAPR